MRAVAIAVPVLERLGSLTGAAWQVVGATRSTLYLHGSQDGFVIALTAPGAPLMPNGVGLDRCPPRWPALGRNVRCAPGSIGLGEDVVRWSASDPPAWDPTVARSIERSDPRSLAARGRAILAACGVAFAAPDIASLVEALASTGISLARDADGRRGVGALLAAVHCRDAARAAAAAQVLLGRGPGLTPEGDDLLCGAAATVYHDGAAAGFRGRHRDAWLEAICPPHARTRSSDLSVTLLRLAAAGQVAEPVADVLRPTASGWRAALARLLRVGSTSGLAYALAIGASAVLLNQPEGGRGRPVHAHRFECCAHAR